MRNQSFLYYLFFATGWTVMVTILLCLPGSAFPSEDWFNKYYVDKIVHAFLFGVLVAGYVLFIRHSNLSDKKQLALWVTVCACLFGLLMEFVQKYYIPHRAFEMLDFAADSTGAVLAYFLLRKKLS
jgi:VanZ family protein